MNSALSWTRNLRSWDIWVAVPYFALYLAYLFWNPESEFFHWATLVVLPLLLVVLLQDRGPNRFSRAFASFGLSKHGLWRGAVVAVGLSVVACLFQLRFSRYSDEIWAIIRSGHVFYLLPLVFLLLMLTAGFTEEFFFRGFLQTRLELLLRSKWLALIVASFCFGLYHVPYAYLNPNWPSSGDFGAALMSAMGQGVPGGLILGGLYIGSNRNLLPCVIVHSSINALPAMTLIRFGGG